MSKSISIEKANQYQDLFNLIYNNYDLVLTVDEMDEIIREVKKIINILETPKKNNPNK